MIERTSYGCVQVSGGRQAQKLCWKKRRTELETPGVKKIPVDGGMEKRTERTSMRKELRPSRRLEVGPRKLVGCGKDLGIRTYETGMYFQCKAT